MKGLHYSIRPDKSYFMTMTVMDWIDVFTRPNHKQLIIDSLKYCQENKGMNIFAWCLMPSHLHLMANTVMGFELADVIRDFRNIHPKNLSARYCMNRKVGGNGCSNGFNWQQTGIRR